MLGNCKELFEAPEVQKALIMLRKNCLESTKVNHSEFFVLLDSSKSSGSDDSDLQPDADSSSESVGGKNQFSANNRRRRTSNVNYKEIDSSEDEEYSLPRKKRKL